MSKTDFSLIIHGCVVDDKANISDEKLLDKISDIMWEVGLGITRWNMTKYHETNNITKEKE